MKKLPDFSFQSYKSLLESFLNSGYTFDLVENIGNNSEDNIIYLRHDIDMHLSGIDKIAELEKELNIFSTYYVPVSLHFNPLYLPNQEVIKKIQNMGHKIGLHYDMTSYPIENNEREEQLDWEVNILQRILSNNIKTICMHQPHKGEEDPFKSSIKYIHPHDPRYQNDLIYISDSCRAWRDERLLDCFTKNKPRKILLNLHPELWLSNSNMNSIDYLNQILMKNGIEENLKYFDQVVRVVWENHPATKLHQLRQQNFTK